MIKRSHKWDSANTICLCVYMDENFIVKLNLSTGMSPVRKDQVHQIQKARERPKYSNRQYQFNKCPHTIIIRDNPNTS